MTKPKPKTEQKKTTVKKAANNSKPGTIGKETMTGDLRDAVLTIIHTLQKPWQQMSEKEQRACVESVEKRVVAIVGDAVRLIAADGRRTIEGKLEQITVKDGFKAVVTMSKDHALRLQAIDSVGKGVLMVVADAGEYKGEKAAAKIDKDQRALPLNDKPVADNAKNIPQNKDAAPKAKKGGGKEKLKEDTAKEAASGSQAASGSKDNAASSQPAADKKE